MAINLNRTTSGGITFTEGARGGHESPVISITRDESWSVKRVFFCKWADWKAFVKEYMGGVTSAGVWTRPKFDDDLPTLPAKRFEVTGLDKARQVTASPHQATYTYACVVITFELAPKDGDKNQTGTAGAMTENLEYTADMITMPSGAFCFQADGMVYDEDGGSVGSIGSGETALTNEVSPGKVMPSASYTLTVDGVPDPPWSDIGLLIGKVNDDVFSPLSVINGLSFAAGRLIFLGVSSERRVLFDPSASDIPVWRLAYKFGFRRIPWNYSYNNNANIGSIGWAELREFTSTKKPFQSGDMDLLLS